MKFQKSDWLIPFKELTKSIVLSIVRIHKDCDSSKFTQHKRRIAPFNVVERPEFAKARLT